MISLPPCQFRAPCAYGTSCSKHNMIFNSHEEAEIYCLKICNERVEA